MCPYNRYARKAITPLYGKNKNNHIVLDSSKKRIFNMANFLLNFQSDDQDVEYDEPLAAGLDDETGMSEAEVEYLHLISPPVSESRVPYYLQPQNRTLKSVKIRSFLMVTKEGFQEYVKSLHDGKRVSKTIHTIK